MGLFSPSATPPATTGNESRPPVCLFGHLFGRLFVLPALLGLLALGAWLVRAWWQGAGRPLPAYVALIAHEQTERSARWQAAEDLARLLHPEAPATANPALDTALAEALQTALAKPLEGEAGASYRKGLPTSPAALPVADRWNLALRPDREDLLLQEYWCGALGSLRLLTGVPVLRQALAPARAKPIRAAALWNLARLAERLGNLGLEQTEVAHEAARILANEREDVDLRSRAAFLLGFLPGPCGNKELTTALAAVQPALRYNAASALAQRGNLAALAVLEEMLDPARLARTLAPDDGSEAEQPAVVLATLHNGLRATVRLAPVLCASESQALLPRIVALAESGPPPIRPQAAQVRASLLPLTP